MSSDDKTDDVCDGNQRNPAILNTLDTVHRSLLYKNLEFNDDGKFPSYGNENSAKRFTNSHPTTQYLDNVSDEVKSKYDRTKSQYKTHNHVAEFQSTDLENVQNSVCEKLNKKCENGLCYCFNSDSDDFQRAPRAPPINIFNSNPTNNAGPLDLLNTINNLSDYLSSINTTTTDDDEYFTSHDYECDSLKRIKFVNRRNSLRRRNENRQSNLKRVEESKILDDIESQIIPMPIGDDNKRDDDIKSTSTNRLSRDFDEVFRYNQDFQTVPLSPKKSEPIVEPQYVAFRSRNNVNIQKPIAKDESEDVRLFNLFMKSGDKPNITITENLDKSIPNLVDNSSKTDDNSRLLNLFLDSGNKLSNLKSSIPSTENLGNIQNQLMAAESQETVVSNPKIKSKHTPKKLHSVENILRAAESQDTIVSNPKARAIKSPKKQASVENSTLATESQETVVPNPKARTSRSPKKSSVVGNITIPAIPVQIGPQNGKRKKIKIRISAKSEKHRNEHDTSITSNETSQTVESTENTEDSYTLETATSENSSYREYSKSNVRREIISDSDSPAIHIIQEINPDSFEVSSKVILNKKKIRDLQGKKNKVKKSPKPTRKIITDNFCNEIIDNLNRSFDEVLQNDDRRSPIIDLNSNKLASGRLEASPKYSGRIIGELFARRLIKMEQKKQRSRSSLMESSFENQARETGTSVSLDTSGSDSSRSKAPKKPPRIFASSNSTVECDDEWLQNRLKNLLNEDVIPKYDLGKKLGWTIPNEKNDIKPSCPTYDDLGCHIGWFPADEKKKHSAGWIFVDDSGKQTDPPQSILNMLNYQQTQNVYTKLSTSNSKPSPQAKTIETTNDVPPPKENIDTVDSVFRLGRGNSPKKKLNDFDNFAQNTTLKSTPEKTASARFLESERRVESENRDIQECPEIEDKGPNYCKKCALKKSDKKRSRVNDALHRTKTFFNSRIPILKHRHNTSDPELYVTPIKKTNVTATNMDLSSNKKKINLVKNLGLITPRKLFQQQQQPPFQCDSCHTSKTTSNNASPARNFDFSRVVLSPKLKSFRLSPKRLFSSNKNGNVATTSVPSHPPVPQQQQSVAANKNNIDTYKSFADDNQSVMVLMGEFLSNIRANVEQDNFNNFNRNEIDDNIDDPVYAEIKLHKNSPDRDDKITELRYTVNNDPSAVYTVVDKKQKSAQQATTNDDCSIDRKCLNEKYQKHHACDTPRRSVEDVSSYDASKFLHAALGDTNYYDTLECKSKFVDTVDTDNVSELISYQSPNESMVTPPPFDSPGNTSRFNNSVEFYRGVKEKLRNSIKRSKRYLSNERRKITEYFDQSFTNGPTPNKHEQYERNQLNIQSEGEQLYQTIKSKLNESAIEITDQYLLSLINQISYQKSIKVQLSNAVSICRATREFESSSELIEAERLLLISNFKELAAKEELVRIDYERDGKIKNPFSNLGTLSIDDIECSLKESVVRDNVANYFYIAVCSYKERVLCTKTVERKDDRILFPKCNIHFKDLEPDYEIKLEFFALRLRKTIRSFSHESKFHLNKESKGFLSNCPSPSTLSPGKLFYSTSSLPKKLNFDAEFSRFKSQGLIELTSFTISSASMNPEENQNCTKIIKKIENSYKFCLDNHKEFKLSSTIYNSNLNGVVMLSLKTEILLQNEIVEGFLNVGECRSENDSIFWNRRWCKLDGLYIYFWNYPNQLYDDLIFKIDLTRVLYDEIKLVDRRLCPRSRTFVVEIFGYHNATEVRKSYYLSADNQNELTRWMNELNCKIKFIRDWKI